MNELLLRRTWMDLRYLAEQKKLNKGECVLYDSTYTKSAETGESNL